MPSAGVRAIRSSSVAAAALGGDDHRPVLDERAVVDEVGDVLARGAPADLAPPLDRVGASRVEADLVAGDDLGEVGADVRRILHRVDGQLGHAAPSPRLHAGDDGALHHRGADLRRARPPTIPSDGGLDRVVHLHRLDEHQLLALAHLLARRRRRW